MTTVATPTGYIAGTWDIDPIHSEVSFQVRHLVVSKVRGRFDAFEGTIVTAEDPAHSSVQVTIDAASIDTNNADRDTHVRSADFLDTDNFAQISFRSTGVRTEDGDLWHLITVNHRCALFQVVAPPVPGGQFRSMPNPYHRRVIGHA